MMPATRARAASSGSGPSSPGCARSAIPAIPIPVSSGATRSATNSRCQSPSGRPNAALVSALYIPITFTGVDVSLLGFELRYEELNFRIGNPNALDLFFGTVLVVTIFEAARRAMGPVLPCIVSIWRTSVHPSEGMSTRKALLAA